MIELVRALFGWRKATQGRTVLGHPGPVDNREAAYIRASNSRLHALFQLSNRYSDTAQAPTFKSVYEKTKSIHTFLVARKRIRELELFHIQNTDHFINTFTVILEAHPKPTAAFPTAGPAETGPGQAKKEKFPARPAPLQNGRETPPPTNGRGLAASGTQIPRLTVPAIRINPAARILYSLPAAPSMGMPQEGSMTREIALSSPPEEKERFLAHVTTRFGIAGISYLGNALVNIPDTTGPSPTGLVAIILWQGQPYAVNFTDGRLFPVQPHPPA